MDHVVHFESFGSDFDSLMKVRYETRSTHGRIARVVCVVLHSCKSLRTHSKCQTTDYLDPVFVSRWNDNVNVADDLQNVQLYGLPMRYDAQVVNDSHINRTVSVFNLSDSTVDIINRVYAKDFSLLGYAPKRREQDWSTYDFNASGVRW